MKYSFVNKSIFGLYFEIYFAWCLEMKGQQVDSVTTVTTRSRLVAVQDA